MSPFLFRCKFMLVILLIYSNKEKVAIGRTDRYFFHLFSIATINGGWLI